MISFPLSDTSYNGLTITEQVWLTHLYEVNIEIKISEAFKECDLKVGKGVLKTEKWVQEISGNNFLLILNPNLS